MAFTDYASLSDDSRVWIYRSSRELNDEEVIQLNQWLEEFVSQWTAHNQQLNSFAKVYKNRFVIIFLDEQSSTAASGCSIDSQVRFMKEIENALNIDLFDRLHFDFLVDEKIISIHKDEIKQRMSEGLIEESSLVFDHLIKCKADFEASWVKPFSKSWHARLV